MTHTSPRLIVPFGSAVLFGQERGNIEALTALREEGCEVLCLVRPEDWAADVRRAVADSGLESVVVPYIYEWHPKRALKFFLHNLVTFPRANLEFLRIVARFRPTHVYAFNPIWALNFLPAILLIGTPLVYRAGDLPTIHNAFHRCLWFCIVKRTRQFVAISKYVRNALLETGADPSRVTVIYNRPPTRKRNNLSSSATASVRVNSVLYVGQLIPAKGVHVLIDAFRLCAEKHPDARLLIAGRLSDWEGDAWARALVAQVAADDLLRDLVSFLGYVEDIPELFRRTAIHVCPSIVEEGLGNVVLEAKFAGRPSIIFRSGGVAELVEDGVDGAVCEEMTAHSLAQALATYLENPDLALRHGIAAKGSLARLGVDRFSQRWRHVIDIAAQSKKAHEPVPQHD